jgi:hypothetical protein
MPAKAGIQTCWTTESTEATEKKEPQMNADGRG